MKTAQENIASLPGRCHAVNNVTKELTIIVAGESGYYPQSNYENLLKNCIASGECKDIDGLADILNEADNITRGQRKAMEWGSMFGWGHKLADPDSYDEKGNIIKDKIK